MLVRARLRARLIGYVFTTVAPALTVAPVRPAIAMRVFEEDAAERAAGILLNVPIEQHGAARARGQGHALLVSRDSISDSAATHATASRRSFIDKSSEASYSVLWFVG